MLTWPQSGTVCTHFGVVLIELCNSEIIVIQEVRARGWFELISASVRLLHGI